MLFSCLIILYCCQLYPFLVLVGGVLVWYDSTCNIFINVVLDVLIGFDVRILVFMWIFLLMQGLFVSIWSNGELSSFGCIGNWTCIWVSCGKLCNVCMSIFWGIMCLPSSLSKLLFCCHFKAKLISLVVLRRWLIELY